jgi:hypothetical protein
MKLFSKQLLSVLLAFGLVILFSFQKAHAEVVRKPVRAGSFYPADPPELTGMIDRLTHKAQKTPVRIPQNKPLKAIIEKKPVLQSHSAWTGPFHRDFERSHLQCCRF